MDRYSHLLSTYRKNKEIARKERILQSSRKEVDINANGTSGYVVKEGQNADKVLGHRVVKSTDNWNIWGS